MTYDQAVLQAKRILDSWARDKGSNEALIHAVAYAIWEAGSPSNDERTGALVIPCDDRSL